MRLGACPGRSEVSLGAQSFCWFCHETAQILTNICNTCNATNFVVICWEMYKCKVNENKKMQSNSTSGSAQDTKQKTNTITRHHESHVTRKSVFGVSDQVRLKPACSASETSWRLDILVLESIDIILSK